MIKTIKKNCDKFVMAITFPFHSIVPVPVILVSLKKKFFF